MGRDLAHQPFHSTLLPLVAFTRSPSILRPKMSEAFLAILDAPRPYRQMSEFPRRPLSCSVAQSLRRETAQVRQLACTVSRWLEVGNPRKTIPNWEAQIPREQTSDCAVLLRTMAVQTR